MELMLRETGAFVESGKRTGVWREPAEPPTNRGGFFGGQSGFSVFLASVSFGLLG